jgi:hypothetical protein
MTSHSLLLLLLAAVIATTTTTHAEQVQEESSLDLRSLRGVEEERHLREVDFFFSTDICKNENDQFGECDQSRFPVCVEGQTMICYNRRPMRDAFYLDTRQPVYYIDYDNVQCYPDTWLGCSSCSPGRYCTSESRCILDEQQYPCAQWI